jgi:DNA-binding MarR family transcriptional regulator
MPVTQTRVSSKELYRAYLMIEVLRSTGEREFPMQLATTFFWIASHDGCLQEELIEQTSLSASSVSRNVSWLGEQHRLGKDGLHLVRREKDQKDYKKWRLYLTPKGLQFARLIEKQLASPLDLND